MRFVGLAVVGLSRNNATEIRGADPMLIFPWEAVVRDAKQADDCYLDADFLPSFTNGAIFKSFEAIHLAADDAPVISFRRTRTQSEQSAIIGVNDENSDTDAWTVQQMESSFLHELRILNNEFILKSHLCQKDEGCKARSSRGAGMKRWAKAKPPKSRSA